MTTAGEAFLRRAASLDQVLRGRTDALAEGVRIPARVRRLGRCVRVEVLRRPVPNVGSVELVFEDGWRLVGALTVEPREPFRIAALTFGPERRLPRSRADVLERIVDLPGRAGLLLVPLADGPVRPVFSAHADLQMNVASVYKLYVLCALVGAVRRGTHRWDDVVRLDDHDRSWPTGLLQDWPPGSPLTLHALAALMTGISDNTAANVLFGVLGADAVYDAMARTGHERPALNAPFLSGREALVLKGVPDETLGSRYRQSDAAGRMRILRAAPSLSDVGLNARPLHVESVGWFASCLDLCRAVGWLRDDADARALLGLGRVLEVAPRLWPYAGAKGGGDAGIVSVAGLLRSTRDRWYVIAATWNDLHAKVDRERFFRVVHDAIHIASREDSLTGPSAACPNPPYP